MINDGVGRSTRELWKGETSVNARVIRDYKNLGEIAQKAKSRSTLESIAKKGLHWWNNIVTQIDDVARINLIR